MELDESDFTALPDYNRLITTITGDMELRHEQDPELLLHPYEVHSFDGGVHTHSKGRCKDFNLMLRKGKADGYLRPLRLFPGRKEPIKIAASKTSSEGQTLLYCAAGAGTLLYQGNSVTLSAGDSSLLPCGTEGFLLASKTEPANFILAYMEQI